VDDDVGAWNRGTLPVGHDTADTASVGSLGEEGGAERETQAD